MGCELVHGDITAAGDVRRAAEGCDALVNAAAVLGGPKQDPAQIDAVNRGGDANVLEVAAAAGVRAVTLSTASFFAHDTPLTEASAIKDPLPDGDHYTAAKAAAFSHALARAERGQDVVVIVPGGCYGPAPAAGRALGSTSFNRTLRAAIRGRLPRYVSIMGPWVLASDVAAATVSAIARGRAGERYLAFGAEDGTSTLEWLNLACEVAGVAHRVAELVIDPDDPEALASYGATLVENATRRNPVPWFRNELTRVRLAYDPVPMRPAMERTVAWLRGIDEIP
jgi:nucleoside-diphosphate-sugar epimerase